MSSQFHPQEYRKIIEKVKQSYGSLAEVFDYFYPPFEHKNKFIQLLHEYLQLKKVKKLLDCSCGTGRVLIPLAMTETYKLVVGSDLSPEMLERAKKKSVNFPIKWIRSEWTELPQNIKYRNFDAIICLGNPMAHVPPWSYKAIFSNIYKLLKKGGIFLLNRRNIEAELGIIKHETKPSSTTIFSSSGNKDNNSLPRISLLNYCHRNGKELLAYFTYHSYNAEYRNQILHLIESNSENIRSNRTFKFKTYYEKEESIKKALHDSGYKEVLKIDFSEGLYSFDNYSEEIYLCAIK